LAKCRVSYGEEDAETLMSMKNLARCYREAGRVENAAVLESHLERLGT
jgi:hypothetical protein